jgi:cytoskeletal protein RodZ
MRKETTSATIFPGLKWGILLATVLLSAGAILAQAQPSATDKSNPQNTSQPPSQTNDQPTAKPPAQTKDDKSKKSDDPPQTKLKIRVTATDDKPVANASVYVRFYESAGIFHHDKLSEMNFKTNEDGSVKIPDVPQGKILIQVVAKGWHTYGKWYEIEKDEETVLIKLEPPPHWY